MPNENAPFVTAVIEHSPQSARQYKAIFRQGMRGIIEYEAYSREEAEAWILNVLGREIRAQIR